MTNLHASGLFGLDADPSGGLSARSGLPLPIGNIVDRVGDARVDGLIGRSWSAGEITYSAPDAPSDYGPGYPVPVGSVSALNAQQLQALHYVLDADNAATPGGLKAGLFSVEAFTGVSLTYREGGTGTATLRFANSEHPTTAYSFAPVVGDARSGDAFFGGSGRAPVQGTADHHAVLMMAGHTLGLKYAHDASEWGATPRAWDSLENTVMSFRSYAGQAIGEYTNETFGMPQTFMVGDIRALQQMYGADFTTNAGATTYSWTPTSGDTFVNGERAIDALGNRIFMAIWDGGGYDTYDLSAYSRDVRIDLTPGAVSKFSDVQTASLGDGRFARGNVYNALQYQGDARSLIEAAIGGSGNDEILGNAGWNVLEGRGGADRLYGGSGSDTLDGGTGNDDLDGGTGADDLDGGEGNDRLDGDSGDDVMMGRAGDDRYEVDSLSDFVAEFAGQGVDTVESTVNHTLGANFENLVLIGSFATGGVGNGLANRIDGSSFGNTLRGMGGDDRLYGAGGADYLRGGDGADRLSGGSGADVLMGGRGADVFDFDRAIHSDPDGNDVLRAADGGVAFDGAGAAAGDRIDLTGIDANETLAGDQAFVFGRMGLGGLWLLEQDGDTVIRGRVGGTGFQFELVIEDGAVRASSYSAADFLL